MFNVQAPRLKVVSAVNQKTEHWRLKTEHSRPRRATPNGETNRNPEIFRNYIKTVNNSRVSFKDLKDAKMRSSTFLTFDKPREFLKSSKPNGETSGRGISNVSSSNSKENVQGSKGKTVQPES
jgi:hypothetical protein